MFLDFWEGPMVRSSIPKFLAWDEGVVDRAAVPFDPRSCLLVALPRSALASFEDGKGTDKPSAPA
jgi:hypothetical protein